MDNSSILEITWFSYADPYLQTEDGTSYTGSFPMGQSPHLEEKSDSREED